MVDQKGHCQPQNLSWIYCPSSIGEVGGGGVSKCSGSWSVGMRFSVSGLMSESRRVGTGESNGLRSVPIGM